MSEPIPHTGPSREAVAEQPDHYGTRTNDRISTVAAPKTGRILAAVSGGLIVLLIAGFAVAFAVRHQTQSEANHDADAIAKAKLVVNVVEVKLTSTHYPLSLPGRTAGWYQSAIYSRVDGYISSWSADIGDSVKQGQVLATIETPDLDQQYAAAKAKAAASDAHVQVAQSNEAIAKVTYDRWRNSEPDAVSEQERQEKKADYTSAVAHVAEAKAQADLDRADVARYKALEGFRSVTAPYDGVVTARKVDVGDLVTAGSSANTSSLYTVSQSNLIRVFVAVPERSAGEMVVDLPARVTSVQYPGRVFSGKVARSSLSFDPQTSTERVEVDVPNTGLALVPGMYVNVNFDLNQLGLLAVPAAALLFKPNGPQVALVSPDGEIHFHDVTIARDDGDTVELASGIKHGDRVALNLSSAATEGEIVDAINDDQDYPITTTPPVPPSPTLQTTGPRPGEPTPASVYPVPNSGTQPPNPARPPATLPVAPVY